MEVYIDDIVVKKQNQKRTYPTFKRNFLLDENVQQEA